MIGKRLKTPATTGTVQVHEWPRSWLVGIGAKRQAPMGA